MTRPTLPALLRQRILILDGAMGSLLQGFGLCEADYRGDRFAGHDRDLKGNHDVLCLTRPDVVRLHLNRTPQRPLVIEGASEPQGAASAAQRKNDGELIP